MENSFFYQAQPIGILMPNSHYPGIVGSVGHASTWPFQVRYQVVECLNVVELATRRINRAELEQCLASARALAKRGVRAITVGGDFLIPHHQELVSTLDIPVVTSALQMLPFASRMIGRRGVAVVTLSAARFRSLDLRPLGVTKSEYQIHAYELGADSHYAQVFDSDKAQADLDILNAEFAAAAKRIQDDGQARIVLMAEANMAPWSSVVAEGTGLPVMDIVNTFRMAASATMRRSYDNIPWRGAPV